MNTRFERKVVRQVLCPSCDDSHWIDCYEEDGKYYTLCFVDVEPYQLTDRDLEYWKINPKPDAE